MGREALVICMHSVQFRVSLENYTAHDWKKLRNLIAPLHGSLRMFALSHNIPYHESYNTSTLAATIGPLPASPTTSTSPSTATPSEEAISPPQPAPNTPHKPSNPTSTTPPTSPATRGPPPGPPNGPTLTPLMIPSATPHPQRILAARIARSRPDRWGFLPAFPDYIEGVLNRGVRILQRISKGAILDEYVGVYIPLPSTEVMHDFGDHVYAFACYGPPVCGEGDEWEDVEDICGLIAGERGNWTRFINRMDAEGANCQYESRVVAGKLRILVVAKRDLRMGEELVDYGPTYFAKE